MRAELSARENVTPSLDGRRTATQLRCDVHSLAKQGAPRLGQGLRRESVPAMRGGGHDAAQRGALAGRC
ncbi:hypothetical protein [Salinivibrio proteolyticus]|uniref:hypothetical protein n=1 Tax=Salinivibrio proteolyticus TaxID=334715 RepID=UPI001E2EB3B2|nr:hypothetical protein [Salinivibrio proteolyticus]